MSEFDPNTKLFLTLSSLEDGEIIQHMFNKDLTGYDDDTIKEIMGIFGLGLVRYYQSLKHKEKYDKA